ncbi:hypothetical protein D9758_014492 [Tetrapyrgos nigripes]|uniref:FIST domain-containing protein n=1 Tax=Tetrapyrgos nigripes TaxID=182062 RepID=A0A8H5FGU9_9AGAR|nr:hypothetical protein D9758_014492 [Tetrapyrgos nigripes]
MHTIISRSPTRILKYIDRLKQSTNSSRSSVIFSVSPPAKSSDLSDFVDALTAWPNASAIGCLAAPTHRDAITCSVAFFKDHDSVLFRSTIPGREQTQVGRWHSFRKPEARIDVASMLEKRGQGRDWDDIWSTGGHEDVDLPEELTNVNPSLVQNIFYFSDQSPEGLSFALNKSFPRANTLGLLASSTPFITGRPVTLFHNKHIYDSGAVGIALTSNSQSRCTLNLPNGLEPLGEVLSVTDSEGNLINTLNNDNPTQLLLSAIRRADIDTTSSNAMSFKEDSEFYLATFDAATSGPGSMTKLHQFHSITAGDPSRGTISLNTQSSSPRVGTPVQFFYRHASSIPASAFSATPSPLATSSLIPSSFISSTTTSSCNSADQTKPILAFAVSPHPTLDSHSGFHFSDQNRDIQSSDSQHPHPDENDPIVVQNTFLAASENGFVLSRRGAATESRSGDVDAREGLTDSEVKGVRSEKREEPWTCTVPGCVADAQL